MNIFAGVEITFLPDLAVWLRWAFAVLLLVCFIWTTQHVFKRLADKRAARRVSIGLLNLLVFGCIVLLVSEIDRTRSKIVAATLLTSGTNIEHVLANHSGDTKTFVLSAALSSKHHTQKLRLPDNWHVINQPEQLVIALDDLQKLTIMGDGLNGSQLRDLQALARSKFQQPVAIAFIPSEIRAGLIDMKWHNQLAIGQRQQVSGKLQLSDANQGLVNLSLVDPAGAVLSSQTLTANAPFKFSFIAKASGRWIYNLVLTDAQSNQLISREPLAFQVSQPTPPSVAIYQSAPSFETRHFKNWATAFDTAMTIVTQISQSKFITQYVNTSSDPETSDSLHQNNPSSQADWVQSDVIIMDGRAWLSLSSAQQQKLQQHVEQGAGLLLMADRQLMNAAAETGLFRSSGSEDSVGAWLDFDVRADEGRAVQTSSKMAGQGIQSEKAIPYLAAQIKVPKAGDKFDILVWNQENAPMIVSQKKGLGQVAVSLISHSYEWQLSGEETFYSQFWQRLIYNIAPAQSLPYWLSPQDNEISLTNHAQKVCAIANVDTDIHSHYINPAQQKIPLKLSAELFDKGKMCSRFWPLQNAWYELRVSDDKGTDKLSLYSYSQRHWQAWQQQRKHQATLAQAKQQITLIPKSQTQALSKLPIWLLFLALMSVLWIERKFYS
ncbi:hypothetical protein [Aliiglaciecola litoralis]|uniref:Aerotolerance regulator N-terminal domain-containing protein n=1 Tax=Aliiglaciecola litoralis TaxID=582857 RepID=A0ABN1LNW5_9ALTE